MNKAISGGATPGRAR